MNKITVTLIISTSSLFLSAIILTIVLLNINSKTALLVQNELSEEEFLEQREYDEYDLKSPNALTDEEIESMYKLNSNEFPAEYKQTIETVIEFNENSQFNPRLSLLMPRSRVDEYQLSGTAIFEFEGDGDISAVGGWANFSPYPENEELRLTEIHIEWPGSNVFGVSPEEEALLADNAIKERGYVSESMEEDGHYYTQKYSKHNVSINVTVRKDNSEIIEFHVEVREPIS